MLPLYVTDCMGLPVSYEDLKSQGSFEETTRAKRQQPKPGEADRRAVQETRDRYFSALDWAKRNVPDEHAPFAASAATTLRHALGHWPTTEQVRARLAEQGRDKATLDAA